jgi:hypothetical protein
MSASTRLNGILSRVHAWECALVRRMARPFPRVDPWLYRHGVNAQTATYALGALCIVSAVCVGAHLEREWIHDLGFSRSPSVIARVPTAIARVSVVSAAGLLGLGAFWALLRRRGSTRPGTAVAYLGVFVWFWTLLDNAGVVYRNWDKIQALSGIPEIAGTTVVLLFSVPVLSFLIRMVGLVIAEERARLKLDALVDQAVRAPSQAGEPMRSEPTPGATGTTAHCGSCRLTDFERARWCGYPLYALLVFAVWRIVDRLCILPPRWLAWREVAIVVFGNAVMPSLYALVLFWPLRGASLQRVWAHLRAQYPDECPWCGYDVHACPTPVCPECGRTRDPASAEENRATPSIREPVAASGAVAPAARD